jgi:acyl-ACP thioesterase
MEAVPFHEKFVVARTGEDDSPRLRLLQVLEEMMETAGRHAEKLRVGVRDLHAKGLTWVLARLHALVARVPEAGAEVRVATWPAGRHRIFAVREFQLHDAAGAELLRATSAWALMNLESRRPARLDPHLPVFSRHPRRMVEDGFPPLPPPYPQAGRTVFRAAGDDIDLNDHVNNTVYLGWGLRSAPAAARCWNPVELEAAFLDEARLGDEVACLTEIGRTAALDAGRGRGETVLLQSLQDAASGRELTRLRTLWRTQGAGKTEGRVREE